jgi:hypothetical protein
VHSSGNVDAANNVNAANQVVSQGYTVNYNGYMQNTSDTWAMLTTARDGGMYGEPQSARASLHVNDIYLRSVGQWLSQRGKSMYITGADGGYGTAVASCGGNQLVAGSCYGADTCSGNDSSGHGGYPSGNSWVCPAINCTHTYAYATCGY